jgi:hypothetical protein
MQTPQGLDAQHGGELFPIDETKLTVYQAALALQGVARPSPARLCCGTRQGVDALRLPVMLPSQLFVTWEKPGPEGTRVEILARGLHFSSRCRICRPYGMIGVGAAAAEARYMTSDPTDWHQALARVSGQLMCGEQRVTTHELFTHLGVPVTVPACRRLRRVMRELGWRGPRLMRFGGKTLKG